MLDNFFIHTQGLCDYIENNCEILKKEKAQWNDFFLFDQIKQK